MEGGRTMIICTGFTCRACTAVVAAMVARPPSLLQPTPSATHPSQSTCKTLLLKFKGKTTLKARGVDDIFLQDSPDYAQ